MHKISLDGQWRFLGRDPQSIEPKSVNLPDINAPDWLAIPVPGDVNQALVDHGKIPNPHYDVNAAKCYWITSKEWWYLKSFDYAMNHKENAELTFAVADGPADLWLNGQYLGCMKNAFHTHAFDVTPLLKPKDNKLLVRFQSLDQLCGGARNKTGGWGDHNTFIRKPGYSFGWDWCLPLPSIGLGGEVALRVDDRRRFNDFGFRPYKTGRVDFLFEVSKRERAAGYEIIINIKGHGANITERIQGKPSAAFCGHGANGAEATAAHYKSYTTVNIPHPKPWWPNGYGEPALYKYKIALKVDGKTVDIRQGRIGLREIESFEEPFRKESGPGISFGLKVNGEKIFCKGTNMAPLEIWPANTTENQYRFYLQKCKEANFNMIRVWGGGHYERELLYDLCDEMGIMIWQDFMFASAGYPLPLLRDSIIVEAQYQIRRLRNHPCIAIWCGCNEDIFSWDYPGEKEDRSQTDTIMFKNTADEDKWKVDRFKYDPELYGMLLRGLVDQLGMGVPYVESSPTSHDDIGNAPNSGNSHISSLKYAMFQSNEHPETFRKYFEQVCSFDSEFCIHGPCSVASYKRFLAPENIWPPNEAWIAHIQRGHHNIPYYEQTFKLAGAIIGLMNDLSTFVKHGQAVHLEMMRGEFESARRNRPDCGGTMFWMFNDCWPTASWSAIDYYRTPKPAYYAAKRACAPLLPIIMERKGMIEFFMSNESSRPVKVEFCYGASGLDGHAIRTRTKRFTLAANSLIKVDAVAKKKNELPLGSYWFVRAKINGKLLSTVTYFPDGWKDIPWPAPRISLKKISGRKQGKNFSTQILVSTDAFARLCHLVYPDDNAQAWFSDNYFDLPGGDTRVVIVQSSKALDMSKLKIGHWLTEW